jgi:hypothetical protein
VVGGQRHARAALLQRKRAGWTPGTVRTCAESLVPTRIRPPYRPARRPSSCFK